MKIKLKKNNGLVLTIALLVTLFAVQGSAKQTSNYFGTNIPFIQNLGQVDNHVQFYARTFGGTVFVTDKNQIIYSLHHPSSSTTGIALKEIPVNGIINRVSGENPSKARISHFKGSDPEVWQQDLPSFELVNMGEVFENIEVKLRASENNVEKLFFVQPNGDPSIIRLQFEGAHSLAINSDGALTVDTDLGICTFSRPVAYQVQNGHKESVEVDYKLSSAGYGFRVGSYDNTRTLVIDPLLASTFVGGSSTDEDYEPSIVTDSQGNVFFTGQTMSTNFPTTPGVFDNSLTGSSDRVVSKFSNDLTTLLASTFIGGSNVETGMGICLDHNDDIYLAGYTSSVNFPVTQGSYDQSFNGGGDDAFVVKLDNNLTTLLASTYIGGNNVEGGGWPRIDVAVGSEGNIYLACLTNSTNMPTGSSSYCRYYRGSQDFFVAKFSADLSTLLGATYLGGSTDEWRPSIQVDSNDNVFIGGTTRTGFPTVSGSYHTNFYGGYYDMVIAKLSGDLSTLLASTYLGSSGEDNLKGIRLDAEGNIFAAGLTSGLTYPTTSGAYDRNFNGGNGDYCVSKLDNNLSTLLASTYVGGTGYDNGEDIFLDSFGNVHVVGFTRSTNFPVTGDAYDASYNGNSNGNDVAFIIMDSSLSTLNYSTYFGSGQEKGKCIVVDKYGSTYLSGITYSPNYPTTPGCFDNTFGYGQTDCFIAKFGSIATGVQQIDNLPERFGLSGNYPNPFNPITSINYSIPIHCKVILTVHDLKGRLVAELVNETRQSGDYSALWDGRDSRGVEVSSGIYTCKLVAGDYSESRKMNLVK